MCILYNKDSGYIYVIEFECVVVLTALCMFS